MNTSPERDETRWSSLYQRERAVDDVFWYAVKTTGIYCRPGCSSRLPKRENVSFFDSCEAAEQAGYRPCKRCTPHLQAPDERRQALLAKACNYIETAANPPELGELAAVVGLSRYYFQRLFKATLGVTPKQYAAAHRMQRFRQQLGEGASVTEAMYEAGFGSSSRGYEQSARELGMTPSAYKNGAAGCSIRYTVAPCSLGWLLVAATERGLCTVELGDSPQALRTALQKRYPKAAFTEAEVELADWIAQVAALMETPEHRLDLPLDIVGTAFQRRVWQALSAIPPGSKATYSEIAEHIGQPRAVRAVAGACAANKLALVIPCHRVVRRDGGLAGYRWGEQRKRALLQHEAAVMQTVHTENT